MSDIKVFNFHFRGCKPSEKIFCLIFSCEKKVNVYFQIYLIRFTGYIMYKVRSIIKCTLIFNFNFRKNFLWSQTQFFISLTLSKNFAVFKIWGYFLIQLNSSWLMTKTTWARTFRTMFYLIKTTLRTNILIKATRTTIIYFTM